MDDGISMFLTVVSEVKSEIMLKRFGDSPKDCDFMRKYSVLGLPYRDGR